MFIVVPDEKCIMRMLHPFLKVSDVPIAIGVSLDPLSMWDVFAPRTLIHKVIIREFPLSRNPIRVNISDEVRPISKDKIIFISVAIAINENTYQDGSIRKDCDSLAMRFVIFPFSVVASIVNAEFKESLELLDIVVALLSVLDIQIFVIAELLHKSLVGLICLWC